ncbi:MAG: hypothetical protein ACRDY6_04595, partial [Acidimicrobiia bacterium]
MASFRDRGTLGDPAPEGSTVDAAAGGAGSRHAGERRAPSALVAFAAVEAVAFVLFLAWGNNQWFRLDEWDFLVDREASDLKTLLEPHNEHWSTLPILVYRALWQLFGLRTYVPYQLCSIVLHLIAAALLRAVMRRAGVDPWIATAAATLFALLGAGSANILWAFQIGFTGALVLGLTHLLLADHDGPLDRRDWLGLAAGIAGLMCSGVAVTMSVVVGLAVLMRRGWRRALFHTAPLAVLYLLWWTAFARDNYGSVARTPETVAPFVRAGFSAAFDAMGQLPGLGLALGATLVIGIVLRWRQLGGATFRKVAAAPLALLVGAIVFLVIAGAGRAAFFGPSFARAGRYVHLVAALSLPALALAADALVRRWRLLVPPVLLLLLAGIPGNLEYLAQREQREPHLLGDSSLMLAFPHVPGADNVPRDLVPLPENARQVTIGWLRDGVSSGRVPDPGVIGSATAAQATFRLSIYQSDAPLPGSSCSRLSRPVERTLVKGQSIGI